ncbi:TetR family transcriptional regulator C-terminal domain-containing protein [Curvibacter sp. HBC28]|uniref:TetR family transcriptional regulator C-terminal domain-containing protein n=1 Tax=Curvibacter microcysteis TaxID=3026419 RepID=A0ABT5MA85_9BURK|nr:TetR/AcrR family transcriptional regulator [Curvibacter sp. HBC28]MDD0813351.1 TetR family transcriptional regulator C-terminal domain-containing protein [Curvibacter sp. HBC28]
MTTPTPDQPPRPRGRPPKVREDQLDVREALLRHGLEVLTEKGFVAAGLDELLSRARVPKGSFYHYFDSKEAYGLALIDHYADYFARKLERHFSQPDRPPLQRLQAFVEDAQNGMAQYDFRRGCLIGNLGQEMNALPDAFRARLLATFEDWQARLAANLRAAQQAGELAALADVAALAAFFWIGWEGAVLRAKLERSAAPLSLFATQFFAALPRPEPL